MNLGSLTNKLDKGYFSGEVVAGSFTSSSGTILSESEVDARIAIATAGLGSVVDDHFTEGSITLGHGTNYNYNYGNPYYEDVFYNTTQLLLEDANYGENSWIDLVGGGIWSKTQKNHILTHKDFYNKTFIGSAVTRRSSYFNAEKYKYGDLLHNQNYNDYAATDIYMGRIGFGTYYGSKLEFRGDMFGMDTDRLMFMKNNYGQGGVSCPTQPFPFIQNNGGGNVPIPNTIYAATKLDKQTGLTINKCNDYYYITRASVSKDGIVVRNAHPFQANDGKFEVEGITMKSWGWNVYSGVQNVLQVTNGSPTASAIGSISINSAHTGISFNTTSDYRLKHSDTPINNPWDRVLSLNPIQHKWKNDDTGLVSEGFFAHELREVVPEAVNGEKDAVDSEGNIVPQTVDITKTIPVLVSALQQAMRRIEKLENKND